jgi:hypothetical protein
MHGLEGHFLTHASRVAAAEAVLNGEATVFGGQSIAALRTMQIGGSGSLGFATGAGVATGLVVSAAVLLVVGGGCYVILKNRRDMEKTRQLALHLYITSYWPKFIMWAVPRAGSTGHALLEPFTFEEFLKHRGEKITIPGRHYR